MFNIILFLSLILLLDSKKVYVLNDSLIAGNGYFYIIDSESGEMFQEINLDTLPAWVYSNGCAGWDYRSTFGENLFIEGNTIHLWKWGAILSNPLELWTLTILPTGHVNVTSCYPLKNFYSLTYIFPNTVAGHVSIASWSDGNTCSDSYRCGAAAIQVSVQNPPTAKNIVTYNFPNHYWGGFGCAVTGGAVSLDGKKIYGLCDFVGANFTIFTFDLVENTTTALNVSGNVYPDLPPTQWSHGPDGGLWSVQRDGTDSAPKTQVRSTNIQTGDSKVIHTIDTKGWCPHQWFSDGYWFDFKDKALYVAVTGHAQHGCIVKLDMANGYKKVWHKSVNTSDLHIANVI